MSEQYLSELRIFSFHYAPQGWAKCNGQLLPINQNQALFALLGTRYGGDGRVNFALPNLQDRTPLHAGDGLEQGQVYGAATHTLTIAEMPGHAHPFTALLDDGDAATPGSRLFAKSRTNRYAPPAEVVAMAPRTVTSVGGSQPHENRQPYLKLNICMALQGVYPPYS